MKHLKALYISKRLFITLLCIVVLFILGFIYPIVFTLAQAVLLVVIVLVALDIIMVFRKGATLQVKRVLPEKLSNGDDNKVFISVVNLFPIKLNLKVIDELPFQFQVRHNEHNLILGSGQERHIFYTLRPVKRGEYHFGAVNVFISTFLDLIRRRIKFDEERMIPVYPSYLQMRQYELMAISNRLMEAGIKKVRRIGRTMEFDQIKEYVAGDEVRNINWNATARSTTLMVNQYQEEKAQQVYCIIDKGRVMQMPFEGMALLDYAINASLVISNIALLKQDKPGLVTFSDKRGDFVPAERRRLQMKRIMEVLYKQDTDFLESDFERLYMDLKRRVNSRSLLLFFTNFESVSSLKRQLPYLQLLAKNHLLVVIFFENTEVSSLALKDAEDIEEVYIKVIAEQMVFAKRQIVKELKMYGIQNILSAPKDLTVNTINKYLEVKARSAI